MKHNKIIVLITISVLLYLTFSFFFKTNKFVGKWEYVTVDFNNLEFVNEYIYIFIDKTALIENKSLNLNCIWELKNEDLMLLNCEFNKDNNWVYVLKYLSDGKITVNDEKKYIKISK
jgi:hypothetical protein